ncbi:MAG: OmpA family protein [Chitinophagaceae bacterium]|jgi:hypothetical protein|nr:OmpA family protein [Chitinophagaceae bacterium]
MRKLALSVLMVTGMLSLSYGQDTAQKKPPVLGLNFMLNDFTTALRIQQSSLRDVLRNNDWARFSEMAYGLSIQYMEGLTKHMDFAGSLAGSFIKYPFPNKPISNSDGLLVEVDAAVNLKLLTDRYIVVPFASVGVGASMFRGSDFGACIPVGIGLQINLGKQDAFLFTQAIYKMAVTHNVADHFVYSFGFAAPLRI